MSLRFSAVKASLQSHRPPKYPHKMQLNCTIQPETFPYSFISSACLNNLSRLSNTFFVKSCSRIPRLHRKGGESHSPGFHLVKRNNSFFGNKRLHCNRSSSLLENNSHACSPPSSLYYSYSILIQNYIMKQHLFSFLQVYTLYQLSNPSPTQLTKMSLKSLTKMQKNPLVILSARCLIY